MDLPNLSITNINVIEQLQEVKIKENPEKPKPKASKLKEYAVKDGDTLEKIAKKYKISWKRLFDKNKNIKHPDLIKVGDKLVIPTEDEELASRDYVIVRDVSQPISEQNVVSASPVLPTAPITTAGNTYGYGYCTWYVKNMRPDLPNSLGNANTWFSVAQSLGLPTGTTPRVSAVGTTTAGSLGHVVYVTAVNSDGTIEVSEMNYAGWNVVSTRTAGANEFIYIY